jgi:hypothetical protein
MSSTPIEDQIRERLACIIGSLQPVAASTGTFPDVRGVQIALTLAVHEIEAASFLAALLSPLHPAQNAKRCDGAPRAWEAAAA